MKKFKYFLFLISFLLLLIGCSNKPPKIEFLKNSDYAEFYIFNHFKNNEPCIKYLFHFSKEKRGLMWILTDKNGVEFEGNIFNTLDTTKQRFYFDKKRGGNIFESVKVNFLENTPVFFKQERENTGIKLTADFETLTVNIVQNFLDYAEKNEMKKENEIYTYILLNKNNQEKMKLIYHEYGAWFEVEVF